MIEGPAGALEVWSVGFGTEPPTGPVWVICHPHPLHGGSMDNKVVFSLAKAAALLGVPSIRFNFRGVGASEGGHDEGRGEGDDLAAVCNRLRTRYPAAPLWLAGFSFGSGVAYQMAGRLPGLEKLLLVAPPVNMSYFQPEQRIAQPWCVIHGEEDQLIPVAEVQRWCEGHPDSPRHRVLAGADHFFHGQLKPLRECAVELMGGG